MGLLDRAGQAPRGRILFEGLELDRAGREVAKLRGRELSMIFQSPRTALNPIRKVGKQIEDVLRRHGPTPGAEARRAAISALGAGAHPRSRAPLRGLSVRTLRRHVPARDDRDGARLRSRFADRRRADDRPRRDDAGGRDGPYSRDRARAAHGDDPHHARSRARRRILRPHPRHARRPHRGGRARRGVSRRISNILTRADCSPRRRPPPSGSTISPLFPVRFPICARTCRPAAIADAASAPFPPAIAAPCRSRPIAPDHSLRCRNPA